MNFKRDTYCILSPCSNITVTFMLRLSTCQMLPQVVTRTISLAWFLKLIPFLTQPTHFFAVVCLIRAWESTCDICMKGSSMYLSQNVQLRELFGTHWRPKQNFPSFCAGCRTLKEQHGDISSSCHWEEGVQGSRFGWKELLRNPKEAISNLQRYNCFPKFRSYSTFRLETEFSFLRRKNIELV